MAGEIVAYRCATCDRILASDEIRSVTAQRTEVKSCAKCGSGLVEERSRVVEPIAAVLARATLYPFRPMTLAVSLVVLSAGFGASFVPGFGGFVAGGIRFAWLFAVLRSAANGADDPQVDPAEISPSTASWSGPFVRYLAAVLVAFGPALIALVTFGANALVVVALLTLLGALYLPAALIIAAHSDSWLPLNPMPVIRLVARIPGQYATACGLLFLLVLLTLGATAAARGLDIPVVSALLEGVIGFLPLVAAARMLGVLVHECREELE